MKCVLSKYNSFIKTLEHEELVFLFGSGISAALTHRAGGWVQWILDGTAYIKDTVLADEIRQSVHHDMSADNLIRAVGEVITATKNDGTYDDWMRDSMESSVIEDKLLADTLKILVAAKAVFLTTNYDLLLEKAADLKTLSYSEPDAVFEMLKRNQNHSVVHIHGVYDYKNKKDDIIADEEQYQSIVNDDAAQFIQNLLSTRTLVLVGCGQTTDDINISRFVTFANEKLRLDRKYYFIAKEGQRIENLPDAFEIIHYGTDYSDLPQFLSDVARECMIARYERNPLVLRSACSDKDSDAYGLSEYHFTREYIPFCGREQELEGLRAFCDDDKQILWWALTGQGGSGKSRLAYEFIKRIAPEYYAFFLEYPVADEFIDSFVPVYDTFIAVDYILHSESAIAHTLTKLVRKFESSSLSLRILFIERENEDITGSWIQRLRDSFDRTVRGRLIGYEYNNPGTVKQHEFLNLKDMTEEDIESFIGKICSIKGLPEDKARDTDLREQYEKKFEQLRFRPLFVQMFVESWINNGCIQADYQDSEDLIRSILSKEQERLLEMVGRDYQRLNQLYHLIIRAAIPGSLNVNQIPVLYKSDWDSIKEFIKTQSASGIQRKEFIRSFLTNIEDGLDGNDVLIQPMYPDIIKEALFLYGVDEDDRGCVGQELWENCPEDYTSFLERALVDFPNNEDLREYVRIESLNTENRYALEARIAVLKNEVVHNNDEAEPLNRILEEEYDFWHDLSQNDDVSPDTRLIVLQGLNMCLTRFYGWSRNETYTVLDEVIGFEGDEAIIRWKADALLEHAAYFEKKESYELSKKIIDAVTDVIHNHSEIAFSQITIFTHKRMLIVNLVCRNKHDAAMKDFSRWYETLDSLNEAEVEAFAQTCYECTLYSEKKFRYDRVADFSFVLQDYAEVWAENPNGYVFNDTVHYYYLNSKYVRISRVATNTMFSENSEIGLRYLNELIDEIEHNEMINEFSGILIGCFWLKVLADITVSDSEAKAYLSRAEELIKAYPNNSFLAENTILLYHLVCHEVFERIPDTGVVKRLYTLYLRFPDDKGVQDAFFEMFIESSELCKWRDYYNKKVIAMYIFGNNKVDFFTELYKAASDYVQKNVGVNDPCPCGSGKKYKKCCKPLGKYEY